MAKTLRVHSLAKEIGVSSKDVIAKCAAEGIELKNHMAAISAGLGESIREWFSVGVDVTSVEIARPVDLEKVKKRPARSSANTKTVESAEEAVDREKLAPAATGTLEPPAVATVEAESPPAEPDVILVAPPIDQPKPETPRIAATAAESALPSTAPEAAEGSAEPPLVETKTVDDRSPKTALPPQPTKPIVPAGPQVVPAPAELKGPRVVRIEAPEPIAAKAPRRTRPPSSPMTPGRPPTGPIRPESIPGATASPAADARRGRGRGTRGKEGPVDRARARSPRRKGADLDVASERLREWRDQDLIERKERLASATGFGLRERRAAEKRRTTSTGAAPGQLGRKSHVEISEPIVLKAFCAAVGAPFGWIVKKMMEHTGSAPTNLNHMIDADTAELLALDLGITLEIIKAKTAAEELCEEYDALERKNLQPRPPVVAMLGHVDHGKTSLLDRIRQANVAQGEAGGITQHIGAYRIDRDDWHVTFLDTPGHEAFTAMRARGAHLTDVVVLVVAADDGVMPQTVEAINHAKAAGVQIVIALNKIDLPNVDLNRIYAQLAEHELAPAEWGGETDVIKTSATTGEGIDDLIEHLSTLSDVMSLEADPTLPAQGTVIEAQMREGQGVVAQVLVRVGTLKRGQIIVCGPGAGRVRALRDDKGKDVAQATPGTPIEVAGLDELPDAGDRLFAVKSLKQAKEIATEIRIERRQAALSTPQKATNLADLLKAGDESEIPVLNVIIKADVQGSVDALRDKLLQFPTDKARLNLLHAAVGTISEADVALAQASGALIIGFHVVAEERSRQAAERSGVEIRLYRIIYEIVDDVHKALEGLLEPLQHYETRGSAEVRKIFHVSRFGTVAGCFVTGGVINRSHRVRLIRDGRIVLEDSPIGTLKRFKDDAREVRNGFECGIKIESFDDVKPGDVIEAFEVIEVAQKL